MIRIYYLIKFLRGVIYQLVRLRVGLLFLGRGSSIMGFRLFKFSGILQIGNYSRINALRGDGILFGKRVKIGDYTIVESAMGLSSTKERIILGDGVGIGDFSYLGGAGGLRIGDDTITGQYFSCHPENHIWTINSAGKENGTTRLGINVGQNCWIGAKVTVLDGSVIGDNCVVAAGAVVKGVFPDNVLIAGVPAVVKKHL